MNVQSRNKLHSQQNDQFHQLKAELIENYAKGSYGLWTNHKVKFMESSYIIDHIKICPNRQGILKFCPGLNNSILAYVRNGYNYMQFISHISADGSILQSVSSKGDIYYMDIYKNYALVVYSPYLENKRYLRVLNLETYYDLKIQCPNTHHQYEQSYPVFIFPESDLICFACQQQQILKIFFYMFPLQSQAPKPIYYCQKILDKKNQLKQVKLNNESMIGWIDPKYKSCSHIEIIVSYINILLQQINVQVYKFPVQHEIQEHNIKITDIWEISIGCFYVQIHVKQEKKQDGIFLSYIWHYRKNQCRKTLFNIQQQHQVQFLNHFRELKVSRSLNLAPIYYIDSLTEQVAAIQSISPDSRRKMMLFYSSLSPQLRYCCTDMRERYIHRKKISKIKVKSQADAKLVITHLLDCLIEECADDLIYQVLMLIQKQGEK